jgi:hypothetical protein
MKTIRKLLFLVMACTYLPEAYSQNLVNNPGFETYSYNSGCAMEYWLCHAPNWTILLNSPDLINSITAPVPPNSFSHQPRTGDGNARFAAPPNGFDEYFYGSTQPLTAGQTYVVSFWIRQDYVTEGAGSVGMHIGSSIPSSHNMTPQILVTPPSTQYVRAYTCYTASSNGPHYLTFGPFGGGGNGVWLLDDVSVTVLDPNDPLPTADLSISQTSYCVTDDVIVNGSNSTNETSYQWDLYEVVNGNEILEYSSGELTGQAGTFSTANVPGFFPHNGECFRLYLSTFGTCKDRTSVDFCYIYPAVDFITDGLPVCELTPVNLEVTGDNGWTYSWSSGQSGVGMKAVTVTPTIGNSTYTVTVTTPQGCISTKTITLNVHSQNNVAPWMDGINGTGEYTYYVSQGDAVFFNSILSNDHLNEQIFYDNSTNLPSGYLAVTPSTWGGAFSFSWVTSLATSTGEYHYTVKVSDGNSCNEGISTFVFRIIVVCDQCPVCISYENRTPSGTTPLPAETKAGKCIEAGLSQPVSTGNANVLFQAGLSITEGPYFDAGPGYEGVIDPTTCITDCEDCCTDWAGFTYDELPNPFYMNFSDGDPTNDFIQVTDTYHPFCAFNAKGYSFEIVDGNGNLVNGGVTGYQGSTCCALESPAPENPIPHSSIWWNGYTENIFGNTVRPNSGVYFYQLILYGCNGQQELKQGFIQVFGSNGMAQASGGSQQAEVTLAEAESPLGPEQQRQLDEAMAERDRLDKELNLFPNPTTDLVQISGAGSGDVYYQVFDDKGVMLSRKEKAVDQTFSLANYSKGTYYIRIYSGTTYAVRKVIKM